MTILTIWAHDRFASNTVSTYNLIKPHVSTSETITNIFSKWKKYFKYN
jgi:hypothetical protein